MSAPIAPLIAAVISVLAIADPATRTAAPLVLVPIWNLVIALVLVAIIVWLIGLTTAKGALTATYGELVQHLNELESWQKQIDQDTPPGPQGPIGCTSLKQLRSQLEDIRDQLAEPGPHWFFGTGYLNVWRRLHSAQVSVVRLVPVDALPFMAATEIQRLSGSAVDGRDSYVQQLRAALTVLGVADLPQRARDLVHVLNQADPPTDPDSSRPLRLAIEQLKSAISEGDSTWDANSLQAFKALDYVGLKPAGPKTLLKDLSAAMQGLKPIPDSGGSVSPSSSEQARNVIAAIRQKMDVYRDSQRAGLLRTRSELMGTVAIASLLVYTVLWAAIAALWTAPTLSQPSTDFEAGVRQVVLGAAVLFGVGALAGLFGALVTREAVPADKPTMTGEDDFGISITKLLGAPVLSGIAGLGGVLLVGYGTAAFSGGINNLDASKIWSGFYPGTAPVSLVVAAVFGLSPNVLLDGLKQRVSSFQSALQTSNVGTGKSSASSAAGTSS